MPGRQTLGCQKRARVLCRRSQPSRLCRSLPDLSSCRTSPVQGSLRRRVAPAPGEIMWLAARGRWLGPHWPVLGFGGAAGQLGCWGLPVTIVSRCPGRGLISPGLRRSGIPENFLRVAKWRRNLLVLHLHLFTVIHASGCTSRLVFTGLVQRGVTFSTIRGMYESLI